MYNYCFFIGRIASTPETKNLPDQKKVLSTRLAIDRPKSKECDFVPIEAWGKTAEIIAKHLSKGDRVGLTCRAKQISYTNKEDKKISYIVFVVQSVTFLDSAKKGSTTPDPELDLPPYDEDGELPYDLMDFDEDINDDV